MFKKGDRVRINRELPRSVVGDRSNLPRRLHYAEFRVRSHNDNDRIVHVEEASAPEGEGQVFLCLPDILVMAKVNEVTLEVDGG